MGKVDQTSDALKYLVEAKTIGLCIKVKLFSQARRSNNKNIRNKLLLLYVSTHKVDDKHQFFRILSSEVYTYKGEIDNELKAIFEKLFDENSSRMSEWCKVKVPLSYQTVPKIIIFVFSKF